MKIHGGMIWRIDSAVSVTILCQMSCLMNKVQGVNSFLLLIQRVDFIFQKDNILILADSKHMWIFW